MNWFRDEVQKQKKHARRRKTTVAGKSTAIHSAADDEDNIATD